MRMKEAMKYYARDLRGSVLVYYGVIVAVHTLILASALSFSTGTVGSSVDGSSIIFLFVVGLCSFKENFLMLSQNGVSRRTQFGAWTAVALAAAAGVAVIDRLLVLLARQMGGALGGAVRFNSLAEQLFSGRVAEGLVLTWLVYFALMMLGTVIAMLFFRLDRLGKVLLGAGTPVMLFVVLPLADSVWFGGAIARASLRFLLWAMGVGTGSILMPILSFAVLGLMLTLFNRLLGRKTVVRK